MDSRFPQRTLFYGWCQNRPGGSDQYSRIICRRRSGLHGRARGESIGEQFHYSKAWFLGFVLLGPQLSILTRIRFQKNSKRLLRHQGHANPYPQRILKNFGIPCARLMWTKVGLVRTGESLQKARDQLQQWAQKLSLTPVNRAGLETRNMVHVGQAIVEGALWRTNSVGAHYRGDFPGHNGSGWKAHSQSQLSPKEFFKNRSGTEEKKSSSGNPDKQSDVFLRANHD